MNVFLKSECKGGFIQDIKETEFGIKILINTVRCDLPVSCTLHVSLTPLCSVTSMLCHSKSLWLYCSESEMDLGLPWALKGSGIDADDIRAEAWRDMKLLMPLSLSVNSHVGQPVIGGDTVEEKSSKVIQKSQLNIEGGYLGDIAPGLFRPVQWPLTHEWDQPSKPPSRDDPNSNHQSTAF